MARLVIIEFEDNAQAQKLVDKLTRDALDSKGRRPVGLIPIPRQFCECPSLTKAGRTVKFGWWICLECKKAQRGWQSPVNLLQPIDNVREQSMSVSFYSYPHMLLGDKFEVR